MAVLFIDFLFYWNSGRRSNKSRAQTCHWASETLLRKGQSWLEIRDAVESHAVYVVLRGLFHSFLVSQVGYDCDFVAVMKIRFDNEDFFVGWKDHRCRSLNPLIFTGELLLPPRLSWPRLLYLTAGE